jgi:hypothetical protein
VKPLANPALGPEWRVTRWEQAGIVVEKISSELRRAFARVLVALGALAAALFLLTLTRDERLVLVTWPVAILLLLVSALAVPAIIRNLFQARRGVRLSFTRAEVRGPLVPRGLFYDLQGLDAVCAPAEVTEVLLRRVPHPPLILSLFEVVLADGRRLQGPEVAHAPGAVDPLEALALAAGEVLSRPVRLEPDGVEGPGVVPPA